MLLALGVRRIAADLVLTSNRAQVGGVPVIPTQGQIVSPRQSPFAFGVGDAGRLDSLDAIDSHAIPLCFCTFLRFSVVAHP